MKFSTALILLAILACCFVVAAAPQKAGTASVAIKNFEFQPKTITVKPGTTVTWTNDQGTHTVTSDTDSFSSPTLSEGKTFSRKFTKKGTYGYHCSFHGSAGHDMSGTIVVR
jgi:plastocyanin